MLKGIKGSIAVTKYGLIFPSKYKSTISVKNANLCTKYVGVINKKFAITITIVTSKVEVTACKNTCCFKVVGFKNPRIAKPIGIKAVSIPKINHSGLLATNTTISRVEIKTVTKANKFVIFLFLSTLFLFNILVI